METATHIYQTFVTEDRACRTRLCCFLLVSESSWINDHKVIAGSVKERI